MEETGWGVSEAAGERQVSRLRRTTLGSESKGDSLTLYTWHFGKERGWPDRSSVDTVRSIYMYESTWE